MSLILVMEIQANALCNSIGWLVWGLPVDESDKMRGATEAMNGIML